MRDISLMVACAHSRSWFSRRANRCIELAALTGVQHCVNRTAAVFDVEPIANVKPFVVTGSCLPSTAFVACANRQPVLD